MDSKVTIAQLKETFRNFSAERNWNKLNSPKDLSMDIVSEAAELMDLFLYTPEQELAQKVQAHRQEIENEVADIAFALLNFCSTLDIDLSNAIEHKLRLTAEKHPPIKPL